MLGKFPRLRSPIWMFSTKNIWKPGRHSFQISTWDQNTSFCSIIQDWSWNLVHSSGYGLCILRVNIATSKDVQGIWRICLTLSERHQMFQAFLSTGSVSPPRSQIKDGSPFYSELYSEQVKGTILHFGFTEWNTKIPVGMQYNGIICKKGQFVVTKNDDSEMI